MDEQDLYANYQAEKLLYLQSFQEQVFGLWFNRFLSAGMDVAKAIAKAKTITEEWSGHPYNVQFFNPEEQIF